MHLSADLQPVLIQLADAERRAGRPTQRPEEQELQKLSLIHI